MAAKFVAIALVTAAVCITVHWTVNGSKQTPTLRGGVQSLRQLEQTDAALSVACFTQLNLLHSNLGGKGPDVGEEAVRYAMTFPHTGEVAVMKITNASEYSAANNQHPGSAFAQINVLTGTAVDLKFEFLDSNDDPVHFHPFMMAFLDFDQGRRGGVETLTVDANLRYELSHASKVNVDQVEDGTRVAFSVSEHGSFSNNPTNPLTLTQEQKQRAVALVFPEGTTEFVISYGASTAPWAHGRNIIFTGVTSASCLPIITQEPISEEEDQADDGVCAIDDPERTDCGFFGITKEQCEARGCCSRPTSEPHNPHNLPWCYYPKTAADFALCAIEDNARANCGFQGITPQECEARGCCSRAPSNPFNPENHPWCFHPAATTAAPRDSR